MVKRKTRKMRLRTLSTTSATIEIPNSNITLEAEKENFVFTAGPGRRNSEYARNAGRKNRNGQEPLNNVTEVEIRNFRNHLTVCRSRTSASPNGWKSRKRRAENAAIEKSGNCAR